MVVVRGILPVLAIDEVVVNESVNRAFPMT